MGEHTAGYNPQSVRIDEALIRRFISGTEFPVTGQELVKTTQRNGAPRYLIDAMQRLTQAKLFHNTYEVWFDTVHPQRPRRAG